MISVSTFRYAFLALDIPYTPAPRWVSSVGFVTVEKRFCGLSTLQYGLDPPKEDQKDLEDASHPAPMFIHANLIKYSKTVPSGNTFGMIKRLAPLTDKLRGFPSPALARVFADIREIDSNLCVDLNLRPMESQDWAVSVESRDPADRLEIEALPLEEIYGGMLKDFAMDFEAEGGPSNGL